VVLQPDVLDKLRKGSGGVSEEIRRRIDRTLFEDGYSQATRSLADAAMWIADEIDRQVGAPWHTSRNGHLAVATALQTWLVELCAPDAASDPTQDSFGPDDPGTLGRSVARQYQRHLLGGKALAMLNPAITTELGRIDKALKEALAREKERGHKQRR
jgi:hypothetical protein